MRFSSALAAPAPLLPLEALPRTPVDDAPQRRVSSVQAWPADCPPDDLDQRVRQVGEWQLGEW